MTGFLKKGLLLAAFFLTLLFIIFIVNQTNQLFILASGINPLLGRAILFFLLALYALIIILPLVAIFSRPPALIPPATDDTHAYAAYLERLAKRLRKNPYLSGQTISGGNLAAIEEAHEKLNKLADEKIKDAASNVFIMTAISQYGALDAAIVVFSQLKMIWQVALIYNQRPTLREMIYLYSNVFATAFLATKIENLEILEDQLEPVIASVMGSSLSSLTPAFNTAANIVTNSVIQGSANAFLTLRVGVIARQYCASLEKPKRSSILSAAIVQATALLAAVLGESTYKVTRAVVRATAKAGKRPFVYSHGLVTGAGRKTWDAGKTTLRKSEELAKKFGDKLKSGGKKMKFYLSGITDDTGE